MRRIHQDSSALSQPGQQCLVSTIKVEQCQYSPPLLRLHSVFGALALSVEVLSPLAELVLLRLKLVFLLRFVDKTCLQFIRLLTKSAKCRALFHQFDLQPV